MQRKGYDGFSGCTCGASGKEILWVHPKSNEKDRSTDEQ